MLRISNKQKNINHIINSNIMYDILLSLNFVRFSKSLKKMKKIKIKNIADEKKKTFLNKIINKKQRILIPKFLKNPIKSLFLLKKN